MHPNELQIQLGENEYTFSALTYRDWGRLQTACQFAPYHQLKDAGATVVVQADMLRICTERLISTQHLMNWCATPQGMAELYWTAIQKHHPEASRDEVCEAMTMKDKESHEAIEQFILKSSLPNMEESEADSSVEKKGSVQIP